VEERWFGKRQRRLPADSKEHEHTFADAIKQPGEDRIDKNSLGIQSPPENGNGT